MSEINENENSDSRSSDINNCNVVITENNVDAQLNSSSNKNHDRSNTFTLPKRKRDQSPDLDNSDSSVEVIHSDESIGESQTQASESSSSISSQQQKSSEDSKSSENNNDDSLPETAIVLNTEWGSKVYVVGTAHFSVQSQEDVAAVIRKVQPHCVVLELCQSRSYILEWEEEQILKQVEKMDFRMMMETMRNNGFMQGAIYLILLSVSDQITRELGMAPGGEFRRAVKEARNIRDCVVYLGDRPIHITLRRALASLSWWQSIKLAVQLLFYKEPIRKEDVERCKNKDFLEEMISQLAGEFPELKKVFVNERDLFLTYGLQNAAMSMSGPQGLRPCNVVGVVGIGHLAGIQKNWNRLSYKDIPEVLRIPPPSRSSKVIKFTLKASLLCLAVYGFQRLAIRTIAYIKR